MPKELIVSATSLETRIAILEDNQVTELFIERDRSRSILGNIYKGRVTRVLPGMQAAFVDIGLDRNAFLYVSDFFEDYEDYEDLFKATDTAVEDFLNREKDKGEARSKSAPKKRKTQKAPPAQKKRDRDSDEGQGARRRTEPPPPQTQRRVSVADAPSDWSDQQILPEHLSLELDDLWLRRRDQDAEQEEGILPSDLSDKKGKSSGGLSKARVEEEPELFQFASRGRRNKNQNNGPLIGDLLKEGQEILVQVAKEPIGKKGARITSHIVFPGRYLVFMPTVDHVGVSRKIESSKERQRLRDLVQDLRGEIDKGFIVRTAGEGKTREDFRQDMVYLTRIWEKIRSKTENSSAPALVHSELDLVQRIVRDFFSDEYRAIRVDDENLYESTVEFISNFNPDLVKKVRLFKRNEPIFDAFNVTEEIEKALKSKVWLASGGYIVINQTEALVAVDVNTGKYVGKTNSLEDTITKTNLEAVREVVRQVRLRDLGGIIVVDFIDMNVASNRKKVLDALHEEMKKDKSPSKILAFNEFGLVAITRKRVKQSLERTLCQPCPTCEGTGLTKSVRTVCFSIYDEVRRMLPMGDSRELIIRCHPSVGRGLEEAEAPVQQEIRDLCGKEVTVVTDPLLGIEQFDLIET